MNCHNDKKENHSNHKHNPLKHMLHMVLCCGVPIVIVGLLPLISKASPSAGGFISKIVPFLCPLMMIGMIPMMMNSGKKSCCESKSHENSDGEVDKLK